MNKPVGVAADMEDEIHGIAHGYGGLQGLADMERRAFAALILLFTSAQL